MAVESITEKMTSLKERPPKERIGISARKYLLEEQIGAVFDKERIAKTLPMIEASCLMIKEAITRHEEGLTGRTGANVPLGDRKVQAALQTAMLL